MHLFFCGFQLVSFVLWHMEIYGATEDTEMANIGLDTCEHIVIVVVVVIVGGSHTSYCCALA